MSLGDLREQVCTANIALANSGLVTLSFGNVSGVDRATGIMIDQAEWSAIREPAAG